MPPAWTDPCNGHFTHELVRGKCPLEIVSSNRVCTGGRRNASVSGILPTVLNDTISTSDLAYINTIDHTMDVGFDFGGSTVQELYDAVKDGTVAAGDAIGELGGRIPSLGGDDQRTVGHTLSAIEKLVSVGAILKNPAQVSGNMLRIWACTTRKMKRLMGPILVVEGSTISQESEDPSTGSKSGKFAVERMTTEAHFDACIYQWSLLAHTLGVMAFEITASFVFETVHVLRIRHNENFWTAQEYFIACLDLLDRKKVKADRLPDHDRGIMLDDARRFGAQFAAKAKPSGQEREARVYNGQCQPADASKIPPCPYWNSGKDHDPKHLNASGKCVFRHVCNHWVTDKGPRGRCESATHSWKNCDNPAKCDSPV